MTIDYNDVVTGELLKWVEIGKEIEGVYLNHESKMTPKGKAEIYEIRHKGGITPFFAPQLLHKKLKTVAIGSIVKIKYLRIEKTSTGNDIKHFDVKSAPATEANLKLLGIEVFTDAQEESDI